LGRRSNARSKFWGDDQRPPFKNCEEVERPAHPLDGRQGINGASMLRELLRRCDMMVMLENKLRRAGAAAYAWLPGA